MSWKYHSLLLRLVLTLLMSLGWCCNGWAQEGGELDDDISQIPQRPHDHILDSARWFTLQEKAEVQKELNRLFDENQVDVYLVTRVKQPPQGAQTYSRSLGEAWSRSPIWCVVFYVPGDPSGFHIEAGGVEVDRQEIKKAVDEASNRARKENSAKDQVMAAWKECSEGLRFLHVSGKRYNERVVQVKEELRSDAAKNELRRKVLIASVLGGVILLVLFTYGVIRLIRRRRFSFEFPETHWRKRFQGPHSGGGGIVVNYRSKRLK